MILKCFGPKGGVLMTQKTVNQLNKNKKKNSVQMGAKIANQINTAQQSNLLLSYSCATTQSATILNVNFA
jgi:hypothetical protein